VQYRRTTTELAAIELPLVADDPASDGDTPQTPATASTQDNKRRPKRKLELLLPERAHPDLGRIGVYWHTQGSGKSYSMAFFVEKVRRNLPSGFTFVIITDREDLDDQIWRTFVGCETVDEKSPRAASGKQLQALLTERHRFVFSLVHQFNQTVREPYSQRDDIIVLSDEAHRTPPTTGSISWPMTSCRAASSASKPASPCWCAWTRSPAGECTSTSGRAGSNTRNSCVPSWRIRKTRWR